MDTILDYNKSEASAYWNLLKNLGKDVKVELISLLASSLASSEPERIVNNEKWASRFRGAWKDERDADEIVNDIRRSRNFSNTRDYLDLL